MNLVLEWDDDFGVKIYSAKGELIGEWDDMAHANYPEDLIWGRVIGGLVRKAYEVGLKEGAKND